MTKALNKSKVLQLKIVLSKIEIKSKQVISIWQFENQSAYKALKC